MLAQEPKRNQPFVESVIEGISVSALNATATLILQVLQKSTAMRYQAF